ncbi:MAG: hypothetical protein V3T39_00875 [Gammaproteobacteria bacterium]
MNIMLDLLNSSRNNLLLFALAVGLLAAPAVAQEPASRAEIVAELRALELNGTEPIRAAKPLYRGKSLVIGPQIVAADDPATELEFGYSTTERFALRYSLANSQSKTGTLAGNRVDPEDLLIGPIRVRGVTPFALQRLDMLPSSAARAYRKRWAVEMNLSNTNTFIMSDNMRDFAAQRAGLARLTQADVDALLQLNDDTFFFDGATGVLNTTAHYAFNDTPDQSR